MVVSSKNGAMVQLLLNSSVIKPIFFLSLLLLFTPLRATNDQPLPPLQIAPNQNVTLLFGGDTHFDWGIEEVIQKVGFDGLVERLKSTFAAATWRAINLETAISEKAEPLAGKAYIFNAPYPMIEVLKLLKVDMAILANNHSLDMGADGLSETIETLKEAEITPHGAGINFNEAITPHIEEIGGILFGFYSVNQIGPDDFQATRNRPGTAPAAALTPQRIQTLKRQVDHVIVNIHWGREYFTTPTDAQQRYARSLIDAGATAIVGHHPHIPQGVELYKDGIILYSLGNFIFGSVIHYQTDNILAELEFEPRSKSFLGATIRPITGRYRNHGHRIRPLTAREAIPFWEELYVLSSDLTPHLERHFQLNSDGTAYFAAPKRPQR